MLCAKLLDWKKYSPFKIVYGLTFLDLISLFIDERIRFDDNRKAQVMKALLKKVYQYFEKKNEKYAFQANKRWKRVIFELENWVWVYMRKERFLGHKKSKLMLKRDEKEWKVCISSKQKMKKGYLWTIRLGLGVYA